MVFLKKKFLEMIGYVQFFLKTCQRALQLFVFKKRMLRKHSIIIGIRGKITNINKTVLNTNWFVE